MIYKREYQPGKGNVFIGLDEKINNQIPEDIKNRNFKLLIYGEWYEPTNLEQLMGFGFQYFKNLDKFMFCFGPKENGRTDYVNIFFIDTFEEGVEAIKSIIRGKIDAWVDSTEYGETQFAIDRAVHHEDHSKMIWRKKGALWVAQGMHGKFTIRHLHRMYIGKYEGELKSFKLRPNQYLKKMKEQCEENYFWEA